MIGGLPKRFMCSRAILDFDASSRILNGNFVSEQNGCPGQLLRILVVIIAFFFNWMGIFTVQIHTIYFVLGPIKYLFLEVYVITIVWCIKLSHIKHLKGCIQIAIMIITNSKIYYLIGSGVTWIWMINSNAAMHCFHTIACLSINYGIIKAIVHSTWLYT